MTNYLGIKNLKNKTVIIFGDSNCVMFLLTHKGYLKKCKKVDN